MLFQRITTAFATARPTRRQTVQAGLLASAAAIAGVSTSKSLAQDATPIPSVDASPIPTDDSAFLFVQSATSGSFRPMNGAGDANFVLTLEGHTGGTIYFSDRPERIFGDAPTERFLDGLGFSPNNPPNAALVVQSESGEPDMIVLELLNPVFDAEAGSLTYGANVLGDYDGDGLRFIADQQTDTDLNDTFSRASLFIDDCPDDVYCFQDNGSGNAPSIVGGIPGGPYGTCWQWSEFTCKPCHQSQSSLDALCNQAYTQCNNDCTAGDYSN